MKRPVIGVALVLGIFLWTVFYLFPDVSETLFGYTRRETKVRELLSERTRFTGEVHSFRITQNGIWIRMCMKEMDVQDICLEIFVRGPADPQMLMESLFKTITAEGSIVFPEKASNPGQRDNLTYSRINRVDATVYADFYWIRTQDTKEGFFEVWSRKVCVAIEKTRLLARDLVSRLWEEEEAGIVAAMVLGERSLMTEETKDLFQNAGIAHVLAISGLHLQLIYTMLVKAFEKISKKKALSMIPLAVLWIYALWTGGSLSSIRAVLMASVSFLSRFISRRHDRICSFWCVWILLLVYEPLYFKSAAFWLSFGALFGMRLGELLAAFGKWMPLAIRKSFASSLGVFVCTAPFLSIFFARVPLLSILTNLLILPICPYLLFFSFLSLLLGSIALPLGEAAAAAVKAMLDGMKGLTMMLDSPKDLILTGCDTLTIFLWVCFLLLLAVSLRLKRQGGAGSFKAVRCACFLLLAFWVFVPDTRWSLCFLDVGQGEAAVFSSGREAVMIDAGPKYEDVIAPYLCFRGVQRIQLLLISHPDYDHIEGAIKMLEDDEFEIAHIAVGNISYAEPRHLEALRALTAEKKVPVHGLSKGDSLNVWHQSASLPSLSLRVLSPEKEDSFGDNNDDSLVVILSVDDIMEVLFAGDITERAERKLLRSLPDKTNLFRVYKAAHHGSRTSSSEAFLRALDPDLAFISAGRENRYGHPHEETLLRLQDLCIPYVCTKDSGAVWISGCGKEFEFRYFWKP